MLERVAKDDPGFAENDILEFRWYDLAGDEQQDKSEACDPLYGKMRSPHLHCVGSASQRAI